MKHKPNRILLATLIPFIVTPITLVAACSSNSNNNNSTDSINQLNFKSNEITLSGQSQIEPKTYKNEADLEKLLFAKRTEILNNLTNPADLKASQISVLPGSIKIRSGALLARVAIKDSQNSDLELVRASDLKFKGFKIAPAFKTDNLTLNGVENEFSSTYKNEADGKLRKLIFAQKEELFDNLNLIENLAEEQISLQNIIPTSGKLSATVAIKEKTTTNLIIGSELITFAGFKADSEVKLETKSRVLVNANMVNLEGYTTDEAIETIDRQWVATNINNLVIGNHEVQTIIDVVSAGAEASTENNTEIQVTFQLAAQKYYMANGNLGNVPSADFVVKITGLKPSQNSNF